SPPGPDRYSQSLLTEHAFEIRVLEHAVRVEPVAQSDEVVEARVALAQHSRIESVHLAPVRTAAVGDHDLLDRLEVLRRVLAPIAVHRDVAAVAAVRGRHPELVG